MGRDCLRATYFFLGRKEKCWRFSLTGQGQGRASLPGGPTTKNMSAINSLLNMAAFRSLILILLACQFGSMVEALALLKLIGRCCC